jgi:hypothetical protein
MADSLVGPLETPDSASLEAARLEIRAGVRDGLEPLRQLVAAMERTMRKAIEVGEHLRKGRGGVR